MTNDSTKHFGNYYPGMTLGRVLVNVTYLSLTVFTMVRTVGIHLVMGR